MENVKLLTNEQLESLNPGMRYTVQKIRSWGFETTDSGDGKTAQFECDLPCPYVHIEVPASKLVDEVDRLMMLLEMEGVVFEDMPHPQEDPEGCAKHPTIEGSYMPAQHLSGFIHLMNVVLPG